MAGKKKGPLKTPATRPVESGLPSVPPEPQQPAPRAGQAGPVCLRMILGLVLLLAAGLKAHQLATQPVVGSGLLSSRAVLIVELECEIILGVWLLSGVFARLAWLVTTASFVAFSFITYSKAVQGEASCGCFGVVTVSPWITLVMDILAVSALVTLRRGFWQSLPAARMRLRLATACLGVVALGAPAAMAAMSFKAAVIDPAGQIIGAGKWVLLEPETWTGKKLPILRYLHMDNAAELAKGKWAVILYRHDCPHCREELGKMRASLKGTEPPRMAFVELPPYGPGRAAFLPEGKNLFFGKLDDSKSWLIETPVMLTLDGGIVRSSPAGIKLAGDSVLTASEAKGEKVQVTASLSMRISQQKAFSDLGFALPNSLQDVTVSIENDTKTEFRIRKALSECVCMKAVSPPSAIGPGQKATFRIRFHAPKDPIRYAKNIALVPADGRDPVLVGIHARVGMPLTAEPAAIDLGTLVAGEERIVPFTICNEQDKPIRPVYGTSSLAGCVPRVPRASADPGGQVTIPLFVKATGAPGSKAEGQVQIQTNCQTQPTVGCRISYSISKEYGISAGTVAAGELAPAGKYSATLRISRAAPGAGDGFVTDVAAAGLDNVSIESRRLDYGAGWADVHLTLIAGPSPGNLAGNLQINLSGHGQPVVVPITGRVVTGSPIAAENSMRTIP